MPQYEELLIMSNCTIHCINVIQQSNHWKALQTATTHRKLRLSPQEATRTPITSSAPGELPSCWGLSVRTQSATELQGECKQRRTRRKLPSSVTQLQIQSNVFKSTSCFLLHPFRAPLLITLLHGVGGDSARKASKAVILFQIRTLMSRCFVTIFRFK